MISLLINFKIKRNLRKVSYKEKFQLIVQKISPIDTNCIVFAYISESSELLI